MTKPIIEYDDKGGVAEYDENGNLIYIRLENGDQTWWKRNSRNKVIHYIHSDENDEVFETWYEYNDNDIVVYFKDTNGLEKWYNEQGIIIHEKYSSGCEVWYKYDSNNKLIHKKNSKGHEMWYEYDNEGKVTHVKNSSGWEAWYEYLPNGRHRIKFSKPILEIRKEFEKSLGLC